MSCPRLSLKLPRNLNPSWDLCDDKTGKHFLDSTEIDDKVGGLFVATRLIGAWGSWAFFHACCQKVERRNFM